MYKFCDTTKTNKRERFIPSEAVSINGVFLENVIDGYRTLHVSGRDDFALELNTQKLPTDLGTRLKSREYPPREFTVTFQLLSNNAIEFRNKISMLQKKLVLHESVQIVFNDDTGFFYTGTCSSLNISDSGLLNVVGTYVITCLFPFKESFNTYGVGNPTNRADYKFICGSSVPTPAKLRVTSFFNVATEIIIELNGVRYETTIDNKSEQALNGRTKEIEGLYTWKFWQFPKLKPGVNTVKTTFKTTSGYSIQNAIASLTYRETHL